MKKIAIIGTAGIPGKYGGFETLAEYLTKQLGTKRDITVYCSSKKYPEKLSEYNNAELKYIPIDANGLQSILYDILSLFSAAKKHDTILILGVSGCIILPFFRLIYPRKKIIINIDGLEHQREKWKKPVQKFLLYSERMAIKYANTTIADNKAIQNYIKKKYNKESILIAYGGDHAQKKLLTLNVIEKYNLPSEYAFKVCRIEPENNIHLILEAFSKAKLPLVMIGNWDKSEYGKKLKIRYKPHNTISLLDPIYDQNILDQIRSNCKIYIHGHSAGGTNPSLVEAMNLGLPIFAFDCAYNRETTLNQGIYFKNSEDLMVLLNSTFEIKLKKLGEAMLKIAQENYTWERIANQYYQMIKN